MKKCPISAPINLLERKNAPFQPEKITFDEILLTKLKELAVSISPKPAFCSFLLKSRCK
jgi:hypothetical protein